MGSGDSPPTAAAAGHAKRPVEPAPTASTWADYTWRTRLLWCLLGPGRVVVLVLARMFLTERFGWHGLLWPLVGWIAALILAGLHLQRFRCPRCGHLFFRQRPRLLALRAERCVHCSLPKE